MGSLTVSQLQLLCIVCLWLRANTRKVWQGTYTRIGEQYTPVSLYTSTSCLKRTAEYIYISMTRIQYQLPMWIRSTTDISTMLVWSIFSRVKVFTLKKTRTTRLNVCGFLIHDSSWYGETCILYTCLSQLGSPTSFSMTSWHRRKLHSATLFAGVTTINNCKWSLTMFFNLHRSHMEATSSDPIWHNHLWTKLPLCSV